MDLAEWFPGFVARHRQRHELMNLPELTAKPLFYEPWRDELVRTQMPEPAMEQASRALAAKKHHKKDHFPALMALAWEYRRAMAGPSAIEADKLASKNCPWCEGSGFAHVRDRDTGTNWSAHCVCPLGTRYLRKARRESKSPTSQFIDLAAIRNGQTYRVMHMGRAVTLDFSDDYAWQASLNRQEIYA